MAIDDAVVDVVAVAASAAVTFQPAAGVEVLIVQVQYGGGSPGTQLVLTVGVYDGTNLSGNTEIGTSTVAGINAFRMFITNTNYLRLLNSIGARDFSYSGVQVK